MTLAKWLERHGPWCCGVGRYPHAVAPEDLHVDDGQALCAVCRHRKEGGG